MQFRTTMQRKVRGIKGDIKPKIQKAEHVNREMEKIGKHYFLEEMLMFYHG